MVIMELKIETIHKETIKPSSPTPPSLKNFKLSLIDLISPRVYVSMIFWYPDAGCNDFSMTKERSQLLKKSLSETLTFFFPFAGRIRSNFIECNDEGVDYIEARVNSHLQHDLITQPNAEILKKLVPIQMEAGDASNGRVLLVKVNIFECGGMAIGISISHKIADMSTMSTFIKSWSAMALEGTRCAVLPDLINPSSLFPPKDIPSLAVIKVLNGEKFLRTRLVFDASNISMLKAKAASTDVPQPTSVEAVTAFLWKCARAAATSNRDGLTKATALSQAVNLRKRMNPPLQENCIGNLVSVFFAEIIPDSETELQVLVQQLRNGIREYSENLVRKLEGGDAATVILETLQRYSDLSKRDEVDFYMCSSWCRFELYGVDFGWGKPRWVSPAGFITTPNLFTLMDSRDGEGMEAWLCLSEAEMGFFQRNEELLQFASVNPIAI